MRWGTHGPCFTAVVFTAAALTGLRRPVAAFNRWVADAIDPRPPQLRMPLLVPVRSTCVRTRFAELTEIDAQITIDEESSDAWIGAWRSAVKTLLKMKLEDAARKLIEERGFKCSEPFTIPYFISADLRSRNLGTRRINCSREDPS